MKNGFFWKIPLLVSLLLTPLPWAYGQTMGTGLEIPDYGVIHIVSEPLSPTALAIGLTNQRIDSFAQNKFQQRGFRVARRDDVAQLFIRAQILGDHLSVLIEFKRAVFYLGEDGEFHVSAGTTWSNGLNGRHLGSADAVIRGLDMLLDDFLNQYISANQ